MAIEILSRVRLPIAPILPDELARKADLFSGGVPNYSLDPVDLGLKWVDGQPVFRRVFILMSGAAVNTNNTILHIPNGWGFSGLVSLSGYINNTADERVPLSFFAATTDYIGVKITSTGNIIERHGSATMNSRTMIVVVDYLGLPTGSASWDGGLTFWDAATGGSSWDVGTRAALAASEPFYWDREEGGATWDAR